VRLANTVRLALRNGPLMALWAILLAAERVTPEALGCDPDEAIGIAATTLSFALDRAEEARRLAPAAEGGSTP
jgi:hypothetical protein